MKTIEMNFILGGVLFILVIASGIWLDKTGVPYAAWLSNVHKLAALGSIVFIAIAIVKWNKQFTLGNFEVMLTILAIVASVGALVSGGIMLAKGEASQLMSIIHKASTAGFIITVGYLVYLYFKNR